MAEGLRDPALSETSQIESPELSSRTIGSAERFPEDHCRKQVVSPLIPLTCVIAVYSRKRLRPGPMYNALRFRRSKWKFLANLTPSLTPHVVISTFPDIRSHLHHNDRNAICSVDVHAIDDTNECPRSPRKAGRRSAARGFSGNVSWKTSDNSILRSAGDAATHRALARCKRQYLSIGAYMGYCPNGGGRSPV